jgi:hypothetical protein
MARSTFWSTDDTIKHRIVSWAAIFETAFAVVFIVSISNILDAPSLLVPGIFTGALLLLRSDESTKFGIQSFKNYENKYMSDWLGYSFDANRWRRPLLWFVTGGILLSAAVLIALCFVTLTYFFSNYFISIRSLLNFMCALASGAIAGQFAMMGGATVLQRFGERFYSRTEILRLALPLCISGASVIFAIGSATASLGAAIGLLIPPAIAISFGRATQVLLGTHLEAAGPSILPMSFLYRIVSVWCFRYEGIHQISSNYTQLVTCTCPRHHPEVVPGYNDNPKHWFTYTRFRDKRKALKWFSSDWVLFNIVIICWFVPAWVYRFFLKSTFYVYWPLAHIGRDFKHSEDADTMIADFKESTLAQLRFAGNAIYLTVFFSVLIIASGEIDKIIKSGSIWSAVFAVDFRSIRLSQGLTVFTAALAVSIFLWTEHVASRHRSKTRKHRRRREQYVRRSLRQIEYLIRLKSILWRTLVIVFVLQSVIVFHPNTWCWLSPRFQIGLSNLMGASIVPINKCLEKERAEVDATGSI